MFHRPTRSLCVQGLTLHRPHVSLGVNFWTQLWVQDLAPRSTSSLCKVKSWTQTLLRGSGEHVSPRGNQLSFWDHCFNEMLPLGPYWGPWALDPGHANLRNLLSFLVLKVNLFIRRAVVVYLRSQLLLVGHNDTQKYLEK